MYHFENHATNLAASRRFMTTIIEQRHRNLTCHLLAVAWKITQSENMARQYIGPLT